MDDFLWRAALVGVGVALAAAPLGCFVVWRRMAYFGDATAHAALLGVALSFAFALPLFSGVLAVALMMGLAIIWLHGRYLALDTLLGVLAHSALAFGLVAVSLLQDVRIDLMAYLFGDILAVTNAQLAIVWAGAIGVVALLSWRWSALLLSTLNPDLAHACGERPDQEEKLLTFCLAIVVAVAIKVVGALLIGALLIIPAAAARPFSRSPEAMAILAAIMGVISALAGLGASLQWDTPTGPTIVCVAAMLFVMSSVLRLISSPRQ